MGVQPSSLVTMRGPLVFPPGNGFPFQGVGSQIVVVCPRALHVVMVTWGPAGRERVIGDAEKKMPAFVLEKWFQGLRRPCQCM